MRTPSIPETFTGRNAILLILTQALAIRLLVFDGVAVNGDTGLYLYDSMQILWGHQPFVDYPARSPIVQYPLAAVLSLAPDHRMLAARALMLLVGLLVGLAVYLLGRQLGGDRVGLTAMALYLLTPFTITWGLWVKTEPIAALFIVTAYIITLKVVDQPSPPYSAAVAIGGLFALALLSRRVAFVHIAALSLFVLWYRHRHRSYALQSTLSLGAVSATSGLLGIAAVLGFMANANPGLTWTFFDMYFIDLFRSGGFGAHGYLPLFGEQYVSHQYANVGPQSLFQTVCQKCGTRTVLVFIETMKVTLIALIPLLIWLQALIDRAPLQFIRDFLPVMILVEVALGVYWAPHAALPLTIFALAVLFIWQADTPTWNDLWTPKAMLVFLALVFLTAGYLYRDRIIYTTYFQDFYPFIAVLGGIALVKTWDVLGYESRPSIPARRVRQAGAIILVLAVYSSAMAAYPYIGPDGEGGRDNWYTMNDVEQYGIDLDDRLDDGDRVFAANPLYVVESDHYLVANMSRRYYLFEGWPNTTVTERLGDRVAADLRSDNVTVAVMTSELQSVLDAHKGVRRAFYDEFCKVDDPLYNSSEHRNLWVKKDDPRMPACGSHVTRPSLGGQP